jgi:methyl-accepting chemotaxis protein
MGFIIVVTSAMLVNLLVPYLGIATEWQQLFIAACAILVGSVLGWIFSKAFTANLQVLTDAAGRLSQGDLSREIQRKNTSFPDETTDLAGSLNEVVASLRELVGTIRNSSAKVAEAAQNLSVTSHQTTATSHEICSTIEQVSRGAETQSEMVEKSSRLIREIALSIDLVADSAKKVSASANATVGAAQLGGESARSTMQLMKQVLDAVERNGGQMVSFNQQVQKIGKIVEVITGIAQKTNLLALNATIEAARAGEAGRGFAVVAEEISKLADSTGDSAGEITQLVESIREENRQMQESMKGTIEEIHSGRKAIDATGGYFGEIMRNAEDTRAKAVGIAELSQNQTQGATGMVAAIDEIARVVTDNAAATEEVSAATQQQSAGMEELARSAEDLSALADQLLEVVRRFKLDEPGKG